MGIFGLFNKGNSSDRESKPSIPWHALTAVEQLDHISEESKSIPVAIFKHSTRCGISRMVLRQFESQYDIPADQLKLYYLDLLAYRDVSNEVGYRFQVLHQSPQLLIIKNESAVAHASHHGISAGSLSKFV